ncbi:MAG: hypothetical protein K2N15_10740 [Lachnospiraceae bacterium]|nr:hypothetical protein [Lachnospiraceae bacterium]
MGKPIEREFGQGKTILKYFDFKGAACVVSSANVVADGIGKKIVKAGTPFPADDATCKGYLLHDVDVTHGDAPGTYIYEGAIDNKKLTEAEVTVSDAAKAATPRVTFFD